MKPYTNSTHGRNHYYHKPKEHKCPKASSDRIGTRTAVRQRAQRDINKQIVGM